MGWDAIVCSSIRLLSKPPRLPPSCLGAALLLPGPP